MAAVICCGWIEGDLQTLTSLRICLRKALHAVHALQIKHGCHWTFAKIIENLHVRAVSQKMNTKRDRKFKKTKMK